MGPREGRNADLRAQLPPDNAVNAARLAEKALALQATAEEEGCKFAMTRGVHPLTQGPTAAGPAGFPLHETGPGSRHGPGDIPGLVSRLGVGEGGPG
jgi:hypothetical protein